MRLPLCTVLLAAALALAVPPFADLYVYSILITVLIWIIFGQAWNLLGGFTGQISFGHAMFLGVGAYTAMIAVNLFHWDMAAALLLGGLLAGLLSVPIGLLIFRLSGPYFALSTLAFAEIIHIVARNWKSVTNGGEGMMLAAPATLFGWRVASKEEYFFVALALVALTVLCCHYLMRSKTGHTFLAVRENQDAAEAMGINTTAAKSQALFVSAFLAGVGGGFYGLYNKFIDPAMTLAVHMSAEMIFVTLLGGIGTITGPVIGAVLLVGMHEGLKDFQLLRAFPSLYLIVYGLLIMIVIVRLPGGVAEGLALLRERLRRARR
jgi:branched-chain amino acid transport system permease protein